MIRIAFRNIFKYQLNSFLLVLLFGITSFFFISGNGLLSYSNNTLRALFVDSVTGDFVISGISDHSISLFGANTPALGDYVPVPRISNAPELVSQIEMLPGEYSITTVVSDAAVLDVGGERRTVPILGVDPTTLERTVPELAITSGSSLHPERAGVLLSASMFENLSASSDKPLIVGDEITLTSSDGVRVRIIGAELVGTYKRPVSIAMADEIVIVDITSARRLVGLPERQAIDTTNSTGPRGASSIDDLFLGDDTVESSGSNTEAGLSLDEVLARASEPESASLRPASSGAVNFLLVRGPLTPELRRLVDRAGAQILSWQEAAGQAALLASLLHIVFRGGFGFFVAAVTLGALNIVYLSVFRRGREVATLRAIGFSDIRIARGLVIEHLLLGVTGWLFGLAATGLLSVSLSVLSLPVPQGLAEMLMGGSFLVLPIDVTSTVAALVLVVCSVGVSIAFPLRRIMRTSIAYALRGGA